jgi:hypothetical protein
MTGYTDNFDHAKPFSDTCIQANLATNVEQTYTIPGAATQKYRAKFEFNASANIYIGLNVTATSPGAGLDTSTANLEFRPSEPKFVKGGDVIHAVSPDAAGAYVGISLLAIPG